MLRNYTDCQRAGTVYIMSDLAIIAVTTKSALLDISKQAAALAVGLQNAAPADKSGAPNNSVQYLFAVSASLASIAEALSVFEPSAGHEPPV